MKTKVQKQAEIKEGQELLAGSKSLLYANFSGMTAENLRKLRRALNENGAKFFVTKKRLLARVLKEKGVEFDTKENKGSVGTVFSKLPSQEVSAIVYKFLKDLGSKKAEEIVGGYDFETKEALTAEDVITLGKLPSREALIGQIMGMFVAPLRSFMYILQEKSKQGPIEAPVATQSAPAETSPQIETTETTGEVKPESEPKPTVETKPEIIDAPVEDKDKAGEKS
jgi:large subunit ribosomal protein L10